MAIITTTVDVNLEDFDKDEIVDYFMNNDLYESLDHEQITSICEYHDIELKYPEGEETLRDQQYDEVFDQLKEKFSVAELEALVNSK